MPLRLAAAAASLLARTEKPMMAALKPSASVTSDSEDAADAGMQDTGGDFLGAELLERPQDRFERALHVGLDD